MNERGRDLSPIALAGRWLGPLVFLAFVLAPPPEMALSTAREHLGVSLEHAVERVLEAQAPEQAEDRSMRRAVAEERVILAHAERMMAAAGVTAWTAIWWTTVAIPIPATSLLPLVLFPLTGVMSAGEAAAPYANPNVFLFLGGFIIALAVERWGLHRRIALHVVARVGVGRRGLVLGFMIATALLSMWISNSATALIMLPIGLAVIRSIEHLDGRPDSNFAAALMLGVAYAASIGGIGTPIGTPPNLALRGQWETLFPDRHELGFGSWMLAFFPLVLVMIPLAWLVLVQITCRPRRGGGAAGVQAVREQLAALPPMGRAERLTLIVFGVTALLWATRAVPIGAADYGWAAALETWLARGPGLDPIFRARDVHDATIAVAMGLLLFLLPGDPDPAGRPRPLMDWTAAERLPFGMLLLFGGGFAIAAGMQATGVSLLCGRLLALAPPSADAFVLLVGACLLVTFLTEITSNTATTQILLPIFAAAAGAVGGVPLEFMLAATISASCAFMLPVATPPNAIVFGSGCVPMRKMVQSGLILNVLGVVVAALTIRWIAAPILG